MSIISEAFERIKTAGRLPIQIQGDTPGSFVYRLFETLQVMQREALPRAIVVLADDDAAAECMISLKNFLAAHAPDLGAASDLVHFPEWDPNPFQGVLPSLKIKNARAGALEAVTQGKKLVLLFCSAVTAQTKLRPIQSLLRKQFSFKVGATLRRDEVFSQLDQLGFERRDHVEDPGTYSVRGEILDYCSPGAALGTRVEFFDRTIERIRVFSLETQRAEGEPLSEATVFPAHPLVFSAEELVAAKEALKAYADERGVPKRLRDPISGALQNGIFEPKLLFLESLLFKDSAPFFLDPLFSFSLVFAPLDAEQRIDAWIKEGEALRESHYKKDELPLLAPADFFSPGLFFNRQFALTGPAAIFFDRIALAERETLAVSVEQFHHLTPEAARARIEALRADHYTTLIFCATQTTQDRVRESVGFSENILLGQFTEGFGLAENKLAVLTDSEVLNLPKKTKRISAASRSKIKNWSDLGGIDELKPGDLVVHIDHGIGQYLGTSEITALGAKTEFLTLEYAGKDKLYLPVYRLNLIQRYRAAGGENPPLSQLGSTLFQREKEKARESIKLLAIDLVKLYAMRAVQVAEPVGPPPDEYENFVARFPFEETPDQLSAIAAVDHDLRSGKVMDRLICGDVGFGKTEVAMRAAYRMVLAGYQVAVLVPTTLLAQQHELSFRQRLEADGVKVASLSRLKNPRQQKETLAGLQSGAVDVIIGTHRLLSRDIHFKKLGMLIIDEEHRFGVEHKEKIKSLRASAHVLTLSATPIPRTLQFSLAGLRDISLISTPPVNRLPIKTYLAKYDASLIQRTIEAELKRGGQVFYVHNRVETIFGTAAKIQTWVPDAKVVVGHGQMGERELEQATLDFYEKRANVLVSTTIIESGLDVPSANTLVVERADLFGLAQLYQIRGRVGRGQQRAYAYLLIPDEGLLTPDAKRRLEVLQKFVELGSGFQIASHDLEIRGGGDFLGANQSGHIAAVGFDLFLELLNEAVADLKANGEDGGRDSAVVESSRDPEIKTPFSAYFPEKYIPDLAQRLSLYRRLSSAKSDSEIQLIEEELLDRFGALPAEALEMLWLIRAKQLLLLYGIDQLTVGPEKVVAKPHPRTLLEPELILKRMMSEPKRFQLSPDSKVIWTYKVSSYKELTFFLEKELNALARRRG